MRKRKHSLKNIILKGIVGIAFMAFCISACLLDSNIWHLALAVCIGSFAVLTLFAWANGHMD